MASEKNKSISRAHLLLAVYWFMKVKRGGSIPGTTLKVLSIEKDYLQNEFRERRGNSAAGEKKHGLSAVQSRAGAKASGKAVVQTNRKAGASVNKKTGAPVRKRSGAAKMIMVGKVMRAILKKERLF